MSMRKILFGPILLAATAGPYVAMDESWREWAVEQQKSLFAGSSTDESNEEQPFGSGDAWLTGALPSPLGPATPGTPTLPGSTAAPEPHVPSVTQLHEAIRFDIYPDWVLQRWPRVSQVRDPDGALGMRVPLVTGTRLDDLTGSLTYFFDQKQQVQRIHFHGYTGDPRRLVDLGVRYLRLEREPNHGAGLYVQRWNGQPTSALRITHSPVARSVDPHTRFLVQMEINRPGNQFRLTEEFQRLLEFDKHTQRW